MRLQKQLPFIVLVIPCFVAAFLGVVNIGETGTTMRSNLEEWVVVSSVFAFLLGALNILRLNINNVRRRRPKWIHSLVLVVTFFISAIIFLSYGSNHDVSIWIINNIANQIDGAIYAMLGFYVCSAAYRTFKAKNMEATVLLISAVLLMLGQAPIGDAIWGKMSTLSQWILDVPNSAGMRAVILGANIGSYSAVIRVVLGMERSWTGGTSQ